MPLASGLLAFEQSLAQLSPSLFLFVSKFTVLVKLVLVTLALITYGLDIFVKQHLLIAKLSPNSSSSWIQLALFSANPTTPAHPPRKVYFPALV